MIEIAKLRETEAELLELMNERLGLSQPSLTRALKRAGRRLPKRQHRHAETIIEAVHKADHPALFAQLSEAEVSKAGARLREHLESIDRKKLRTDSLLRLVSSLAFNFLVLAAIVIVLLKLRGFV